MELVIGGNCGVYYSICSLVVTQLDTQDRRLDENRMLSHGRPVIVHYERESQSHCSLATKGHGSAGGADLSSMQWNEAARVITVNTSRRHHQARSPVACSPLGSASTGRHAV